MTILQIPVVLDQVGPHPLDLGEGTLTVNNCFWVIYPIVLLKVFY